MAAPLHWRRRLARGFNQSDDLLRELTRRHPALARAASDGARLRRVRGATRQVASTKAARLHNLRGAFEVSGAISGRSILIVDDVCTTGATGNAMARALLDAGANDVHLWCLARTPLD